MNPTAYRRGDLALIALPGWFGKARPVLVIQPSDMVRLGSEAVMVCPLSSELSGDTVVRVAIDPAPGNGLRLRSEITVEKSIAVPRDKLRDVIGHVDDATLRAVERAAAVVFGIGTGRR